MGQEVCLHLSVVTFTPTSLQRLKVANECKLNYQQPNNNRMPTYQHIYCVKQPKDPPVARSTQSVFPLSLKAPQICPLKQLLAST